MTHILLIARRGAEVVDHDHDGVQSRHLRGGIGRVGVRYRAQLPAGTARVGLARCRTEEVLGDGRIVPGGVVEAAGNGGGVAVGGAVAVVESIPGFWVNGSAR